MQHFEVVQDAGEVVFVPSMWYHEVVNLEDAISINHNWFNGTNILVVLKVMLSSLSDVEKELADCRETSDDAEWEEMCMRVLKANHGMNFEDLFNLLDFIKEQRRSGERLALNGSRLGEKHISFDLQMIKKAEEYAMEHLPPYFKAIRNRNIKV